MIEQFGVTNPNDQNEVLKYIYGVDIKILKERKNITIYSVHSSTGLEFYYEDTTGYWSKKEYDSNGNNIYYINHRGEWSKSEYDENGKRIHYETFDGYIEN
jgi:hypothetical protein